jgi:hypothetical protein
VKGNVAPAITLENLYATLRKLLAGGNNVSNFRVSSERDDRGVFQQQENVADKAIFAKLDQLLLQA